MSATATPNRFTYFRELDQRGAQSRAVLGVRAMVLIGAGGLLWWAPEDVLQLALMAVGAVFAYDGGRRVLALMLGSTTRHFRPMNIALASFQLSVTGLIAIRPLGAAQIIATLACILIIIRGVLIAAAMAETEAFQTRQVLWMLASAGLSILAGLFMLPRSAGDLRIFAGLLGLALALIGFGQVLRLGERKQAAQMAEAARAAVRARARRTPPAALADPEPGSGARRIAALDHALAHRPLLPHKTSSRSFGASIDVHRYQRPLIVLSHPDDLEGFTGGLAYSLRAPAVSAVMSGGDKGRWRAEHEALSPEQFMAMRFEESVQSGYLLGVEAILWMGHRDHEIEYDEAAVQRMLHLLNAVQPDMVATFEYRVPLSYYPHRDHIQTGLIVREAVRRYHATGARADLLLTSTIAPNAFLDVTHVRRIKLEALACHTTQDALNAIIFPFFERLVTSIWGAFSGVESAEGYRRVRPGALQVRESSGRLMKWLHRVGW